MIVNQLEDTMKCGPKPKDKTEAPATNKEHNNQSLKKCVGEQRNSYIPKLSNPKLK
jgi:hypothetical protein